MPSYRYRPLPPGYIRLLRLHPNQDEHAPIQCELLHYPLSGSRKGTHLYEALSYYWGPPEKTRVVSTEAGSLLVTENLHAALCRLRDSFLERIIWADAICIDQEDAEEKGCQVQLMAEIYARASRVIVWLEETTGDHQLHSGSQDDSYEAIQATSLAAGESPTGFDSEEDSEEDVEADSKEDGEEDSEEKKLQAVVKLLNRAWFRRIWVLQEVAASRHILIMCHSIEIDGHAFCKGLSNLNLEHHVDDDTFIRILSTTYLMKAATLRPKYALSGSERFSLRIRPLTELLDLYHNRDATDRRDKVYALLGMSTDTPSGLVPDYRISWEDLFRQLMKSLLPENASVITCHQSETAVMKSKGCILGKVSRASPGKVWEDSQRVGFYLQNATERHIELRWTLQASAKRIRVGDIICLLQGASQPSVIRMYEDYFAVIAIAIDPIIPGGKKHYHAVAVQDVYLDLCSQTYFPHDFLLVWDWKVSGEETESDRNFDCFLNNRAISCEDPAKTERLKNMGLILRDMGYYRRAIERFHSAMATCSGVSERDQAGALAFMDHLFWTYFTRNNPDEAKRLWAVTNQLGSGRGYPDITEDLLVRVASDCQKEPMEVLLDARSEQLNITENVLIAAAENPRFGTDIMALLLDSKGDRITITEDVLKAAARNQANERVIAFLLERRGDQITITEDILVAAEVGLCRGPSIKVILEWERSQITVNERVIGIILSQNSAHWSSPGDITELMALLLKLQSGPIMITRNIVEVIVAKYSEWTRRNSAQLTDNESREFKRCAEMLDMLLDWQGCRVVVTEDASKIIAEHFPWRNIIE